MKRVRTYVHQKVGGRGLGGNREVPIIFPSPRGTDD